MCPWTPDCSLSAPEAVVAAVPGVAVPELGTASLAPPPVVVVSARPELVGVAPLSASDPPIAVPTPEVVFPAGSSIDPIHPSQKLDLEL